MKLSREHSISETLLRQVELNNTAKIAGLRWQEKQTFDVVSINSLASRVLCERHNSALSSLDNAIGQFSLAIREFDHAIRRGAQGAAVEDRVFCGDDIQRWMLKCVIGMITSGNLNGNIKPECAEVLVGRMTWPIGWGLYWLNGASNIIYHSDSLAIETALHPETQTVLLVRFVLRGMRLGLCMGKPDHPQAFGIFKPCALVFRAPDREGRLILEWDDHIESPQAVFLQSAGTYDGPPPDWQAWEQEG